MRSAGKHVNLQELLQFYALDKICYRYMCYFAHVYEYILIYFHKIIEVLEPTVHNGSLWKHFDTTRKK